LLGILFVAAAFGQTALEQGLAAYKQRDFATALRQFRIAAEAGDPTAMFSLGFMYLQGEGVPQDPKEAAHWLSLAAERGVAPAQHSLALLYYEGRGVEKNSAVAANYFESAALQGLADAQYNLGVLYSHGDGVRQDWALARFWHEKAAEQGMTDAQVALGVMAARGQGVPRDYEAAARWFGKAAAAGNQKARQALETAFDSHPALYTEDSQGEGNQTTAPLAAPQPEAPSPGDTQKEAPAEKPFWEDPPPLLSASSFRELQGRAVAGNVDALIALSWQYLHGVSTQASLVRSYVWAVTAERRGSEIAGRMARFIYSRMSDLQRAAARSILEQRY
jgi:TPR repeat protein